MYRLACVIMLGLMGCRPGTTARLSNADASRLAAEGIVRRGDDLSFRYTHGAARSNASWEDRRASIVVTHVSVLVHKNDKIGIDIRPGHADEYAVERSGNRIRIRMGKGRASEIWSFEPLADANGWATDLRGAIRAATPDSAP